MDKGGSCGVRNKIAERSWYAQVSQALAPYFQVLRLREFQESLGIEMVNLFLLHHAERRAFQKCTPLFVRAKWIINREENTITSHDL
jgi:hypothetical protein